MKNKILCCILHTEKQPEQYEAIKKTWGTRIDHMYYSDHEDASKNIVKVSDRSDYKSCVEKNAKVFKVLVNDCRYNDYDYYFFVDNDTYVNETKLRSSIEKGEFSEDKIYGATWRDKNGGNWLMGGAGFLMNRKVLKKFEDCEIIETAKYSDVNVQNHAFRNGVVIVHHSNFNTGKPKKWHKWNIHEQYTFHYIRGIDPMVQLDNTIRDSLSSSKIRIQEEYK